MKTFRPETTRQEVLYYSKLYYLILLLTVSLSAKDGITQQSTSEIDLEKLIEQIDTEESGTNPEQLTEYLHELAANPVNVNRAELDKLLEIPFMSLPVAKSILDFRSGNSIFTSIADLVNVPGIGNKTLEKLRPFLTTGSPSEKIKDFYLNPAYWTKNVRAETITRYQRTLQTREGFRRTPEEGGYTGDPGKYYQRFRLHSDHLSLNLTQEKDIGEPVGFP